MRRGLLHGILTSSLLIFSLLFLSCSTEKGRGDSPITIVTLGDSITKGLRQDVSAEHIFSSILEDLLLEVGLNVEVINQGVSGEKTDVALSRIEQEVLSLEPDYVVIMYGTNDAFIDEGKTQPRLPLEAYQHNLVELVKRCRESGAVPLFMTSIPMGERSRAGSFDPYVYQGVNFLLEAYAEICREVARAEDVPLCDLYAEWSAYAGSGMSIDRWMTDGVHPNPEGHGLIAKSLEVPTIHRVIDLQGLKRLIMFSGLYPIRMAVSEDDGLSWTPLSPIGDFGGIVAMGCVERLKNGDYLAMFHDDGRFIRNAGKTTGVFTLYKILSRDGGLSWSGLEEIIKGSRVHLCEPGILRSPDGNQLAVLLRENSRTRNSWVIFSDDEGLTWTEPRELPASLTGDRHTGRYAQDGRLFISFRDRTHLSPTWGDWVAWVGTYEDIVEGREGQYRVRLMDNTRSADCAYPGVEMLPDGTIITTTYGHWDEGEQPYVVSVRLRLAELDSMAAEGDVMAVERRLP
jgi:lysophospholipase L1-like esterase